MDKNNKKCLIYSARAFICRIGGLNSLKGSCGNTQITNGRDLDIKSVKELSKHIKNLSKSFLSENEKGEDKSLRNYDFLRI